MKYDIQYSNAIDWKAIKKLPKNQKKHILNMITSKLGEHPEVFGKPLRRTLKGFRSLRVGDYRVLFQIHKTTVYIFAIEHRSVIYDKYHKEISEMEKDA